MAKYRITPSSKAIIQLPISIGHKAEKGVEAIEFDLTAWVETYGSGTLTVIMRRWGDAIPYPIALEIDENNKATWTLSDIDTAKAGMAYAQLNYIVGDEVVKKSDIYTFRVMDSLTGEGEPPEAYESWLEHLTHLAAEAMAEVLDIEGVVTDKTLTVDGGIADAKATGDALALKADKSTTYTKTEVDALIDEVEVETDTTLSVSGAPADAKKTGDEISAIKADLANQTGLYHWNERGLIDLSGSSVNLTPETNQGIDYAVIDCSAGDKFIITGTGGNKSRVWGFIDGNNAILTVSDANATVENFEITAPTNAVKLILNAYRNSDIYAYKVGNNLATKASNGLSDEVKEAILDCFRNVYWFNGTDGKESYNALLEAFGMTDFYNKWQWDSDEGLIRAYLGSCDPNQSNTEQYPSRTSYNSVISTRRTIAATKGKAPYYVLNQSAVKSSFYPIPIPKTAGKYRISLAPDSTDYYVFVHVVRLHDSYYGDSIAEYKTTWTRCSSTNPVEKALPDNPGNLFLICNVKLSSAGTSTPPEPSKVSITFLEE